MIAIILALLVFLFIVKNLRFIIGCTIALLIAGFIMEPAHAEGARVTPCNGTVECQNQVLQKTQQLCDSGLMAFCHTHAEIAASVVQNTNTFEYQSAAFRQFARACETTGNPQFCDARDGAYIRAMKLQPQTHYVTSPKSRYQQLDEACRGGHGDDPQTRKACKKRDAMDKAGQ